MKHDTHENRAINAVCAAQTWLDLIKQKMEADETLPDMADLEEAIVKLKTVCEGMQ